jgi:hypothetical protein
MAMILAILIIVYRKENRCSDMIKGSNTYALNLTRACQYGETKVSRLFN